MGRLTEELIKATTEVEVAKILDENMSIDDIAKKQGISKQNVYRTLTIGMGKMYRQLKKDFKLTPAEAMKYLMTFLQADATEVMAYLDKETRSEVEAYIKQHGAD